MRTRRVLPLLAPILLFGSGAVVWGQSESFEDDVVVTEVLLDALVTDKKGRAILGLGKEDFRVTERGEPVELLAATFYSGREQIGELPDLEGFDLDRIPEDRHFILFLQDSRRASSRLNNLFVRQQMAGQALIEWVETRLDPTDRLAVASFDAKLKLHQDFTRDRERLVAAIGSAVRGRDPESEWPSRQPPPEEIGPLRAALPAGKELRKASGNLYKAVTRLAEAAAGVPGRKNLIYLGTGFDPIGSADSFRMTPMIEALNRANVAVYAIDLLPPEVRHSSRSTLSRLALATGGDAFFTFIRFSSPLEQVAKTATGYYLLAYRSRHPAGTTGYQRVRVDVVNPEFRVRARAGYAYGEP